MLRFMFVLFCMFGHITQAEGILISAQFEDLIIDGPLGPQPYSGWFTIDTENLPHDRRPPVYLAIVTSPLVATVVTITDSLRIDPPGLWTVQFAMRDLEPIQHVQIFLPGRDDNNELTPAYMRFDSLQSVPVPEPGTFVLLLLPILLLSRKR